MTDREMFEKSFSRPKDFFKKSFAEQWGIDKKLGLLDWTGSKLTTADKLRFNKHYK